MQGTNGRIIQRVIGIEKMGQEIERKFKTDEAVAKEYLNRALNGEFVIKYIEQAYLTVNPVVRIQFREMASAGLIPGVKKASW